MKTIPAGFATLVAAFATRLAALTAVVAFALPTHAGEVQVAVAANFSAPMRKIAAHFERDTGHRANLSFGATGKFYAQIRNGAPFEVLLAADDTTPARLEQAGLGVKGSRFTYATGQLVLWSKRAQFVDDQGAVLKSGKFDRIALADPRLAPYGAAAIEVMTRLGLIQALESRFVLGESISQAFQFVATENVPLGFVALSQVFADGKVTEGSAWRVPADLYSPIRQDAILLAKGKDKAAAISLMAYLQGDQAKAVMRAFGYDL